MSLDLQAEEKPPSRPEALRLRDGEGYPDQLHVIWNVAPGASSYELELSWSGGTSQATNLTAPEYVFNDLVANRHYVVRARALNEAGASEWSAPLSASTLPPKPPAPDQQNAQMIDSALPVTLHWNAQETADKADNGSAMRVIVGRAVGGGPIDVISPSSINEAKQLEDTFGETYISNSEYRIRLLATAPNGELIVSPWSDPLKPIVSVFAELRTPNQNEVRTNAIRALRFYHA